MDNWIPVVEDTPRLTNKKRAMSYSDKVLICLEDGYQPLIAVSQKKYRHGSNRDGFA